MLCNSDEDLDDRGGVRRRRRRRTDGRRRHRGRVPGASRRCSRLLDGGIPVVAVDRRPADARVDSVVVDNRRGGADRDRAPARARCAAHRVHHRPEPGRHRERTRCTATATRSPRAGSRSDRALVRRADFKEEGGYRAARSLLEQPVATGRAVRGQRPDDGRRAARAARARPARPRRRRARRLRRLAAGRRSTQPAAHGRDPARLRDRPGRRRRSSPPRADARTGAEHVVCSPTLVVRESSHPPAPPEPAACLKSIS